nr:MAG TPA: hypothetical protein [Caudoviricetes sp.]
MKNRWSNVNDKSFFEEANTGLIYLPLIMPIEVTG